MFSRYLILFASLLLFSRAHSQEKVDSVISIPRSQFFVDILRRQYPISCFQGIEAQSYLRFKSPVLRAMPVEYLATKQGLFLHFGRSGKLYKMEDRGDSLLYFVRIDRTINQNYNIGSHLFCSQDQIFELSGYGFWKSNGLLRQFNYTDQEWDIVPSNREVHLPLVANSRCNAWRDTAGAYLYVPYQVVINDGMSSSWNEAAVDRVSYRLDVKKRLWEEMGEVTDPALTLFNTANFVTYPSDRGLFLGFNKGIYFADFTTNSISFLNDPPLVQTLLRLQSGSHSYYYKGWVYSLNAASYQYDSIRLDPSRFVTTGDVIWTKARFVSVWYLLLGLPLLLVLLVLYRIRNRKKSKGALVGDTAVMQQLRPFTETEQSLLQLLLSRSSKGLTASITDINYVLGLKDKSPGMQKKVRSDVMSSINEKFAFVARMPTPLIQSIRSESDKRYFEYMIHPDCREKLGQLLP